MDFDKIKFTGKDVIHLVGFAGMQMTLYFNLVSEIRQNKVFDEADKKVIDYRLRSLEKGNLSDKGNIAEYAILPKETKLEDE